MKILLIRFSSIGDIVLTSPVIRCLKQQTGAEIHYLCKASYRSILEGNPYLDRIISYDGDFGATVGLLKSERYDWMIDLHKNLRSWRFRWALRRPTRSFDKLNWEKWLMVRFKINRLPERHIVDRYLESVKHLGVRYDGAGLDYFIPPGKVAELDEQLAKAGIPAGGYLVFAIGAAHATKQLPLERMRAICAAVQQPIVLLGGPAERSLGGAVAEGFAQVINTCGELSLHGSARAIQRADAVLTHDTGMMHIAAAFQKPIISVWGNTIPAFGMTPFYSNEVDLNTTMEVRGLSCRPCSKIGHTACPKGHFKCMEEQSIEQIAEAVQASLSRGGK